MSTIGGDYSLESTPESLYCGTERFLGNFGPLSLGSLFQSFCTIMTCSAHTKVQRVQVHRWRSHTSFLQNPRKWRSHQSWVFFAVCEGAPSCWKVKGLTLKCIFISTCTRVKVFSIYDFAVILAPYLSKMKEDLQLLETAAQTITEAGY